MKQARTAPITNGTMMFEISTPDSEITRISVSQNAA